MDWLLVTTVGVMWLLSLALAWFNGKWTGERDEARRALARLEAKHRPSPSGIPLGEPEMLRKGP